jgi:hypothetical protein
MGGIAGNCYLARWAAKNGLRYSARNPQLVAECSKLKGKERKVLKDKV